MSFDTQRQAADPHWSVFVTANAGTGKTRTLVDRVARLLLQRVPPGDILCVTYTKAAAAEMQTRLFERLGDWAILDDATLRNSLAELDGREGTELEPVELKEARRLFARALETPGGLKIQTLHAFCEKLLRRFPLEAGVSPSFTVLDSEGAAELSRVAQHDLATAAGRDPAGPLGQAWQRFVMLFDWSRFKDLLALLESRREELAAYVSALERGQAPTPAQLVGATSDATPQEIGQTYLEGLLPARWTAMALALEQSSKKTDQDMAALMRAAGPPFNSLMDLAPVFLTQGGTPRARLTTQEAPPQVADFLAGQSERFLSALTDYRLAEVAQDTWHVLTLARVYGSLYDQAKAATSALDFSDLVSRARALVQEVEDARWVLFKLDGGLEHILLDEAQDTAPEQWSLIRSLSDDFFSGGGAERWQRARSGSAGITRRPDRTLFVVGDEKQSIYSFQGARPERLRIEARGYLDRIGPDRFKEVELGRSFRTTATVLNFVDRVFDTPERLPSLVGVEGGWVGHDAHRQGQVGSVELWPLFEDPQNDERDPWDPVDQDSATSARKQLATALARDIRHQVESGAGVYKRGSARLRPCHYGDFLVLVRRRDATFEEILRALKAEKVPVAGADRLKLSEHIVFDDFKALARFLLFPSDDLSLAEVLRSPFIDVPDFGPADSLFELAEKTARGGRSLWSNLKARAHEQPRWRSAASWLEGLIARRSDSPFALFSWSLNQLDDLGRSGRARILARLGDEAEDAIDEVLNQVLAAEQRGAWDLETCLAQLERADVQVKRELEGPRGEVRVMTVHGAKGLEAPVVYLPDTTSSPKAQGPTLMRVEIADTDLAGWLMAPSSKAQDVPATARARQQLDGLVQDESLRLLYVALTRARDRLVIMGRQLKRPAAGFDAGSWWDVLAQTFSTWPSDGPDPLQQLDNGCLRIGNTLPPCEPPAAAAQPPSESLLSPLPPWAAVAAPVDPQARLATPSQMGEVLRLVAPSPLSRDAAGLGRFRRGDLIHRLLERLPELPPEQWPRAARRILSRERDLSDDQRQEMIHAALGVLNDSQFGDVFGPGSRPEAAVAGFSPELGVRLSGRIDRLVIRPNRVLLIDFKTNRPAPKRIEDADPAYILQMASYVSVMRQLYRDHVVGAALVWTDGPALMPIPAAMIAQALTGLGPADPA